MIAKLMKHFGKPEGILGNILVSMMNIGHAPFIREVLEQIEIHPNDTILDIGCGGGYAIDQMLKRGGTACGVDISDVSVRKASKVNRKAIKDGRAFIEQADVNDLPFREQSFDLVTAFETIYFWTNIRKSFQDIYRILKPGGRFLVAVEAYMEDGQFVNFPRPFRCLKISLYSTEELLSLVKDAGFANCEVRQSPKKKWICAIGRKE